MLLVLRNDAIRIGLYQGHIESNMLNFRGGDVRALFDRLSAKGLQFEGNVIEEDDGSVGATMRDPDGNVIYFNTYPDETMPT